MSELINFNDLQNQYIEKNMNFDESNFSTAQEFEEAQLDRSYELSEKFLNEALSELNGKSPIEYFDSMDTKTLANMLYRYYLELDDVPDAIVQVIPNKKDIGDELFALLKDDENEEWFRIYLVDLLVQLEYEKCLDYYCQIVLKSLSHDDLADAVIDALKQMDEYKVQTHLMELFDEASEDAKYRMLDILAVPNCDDKILDYVIDKLYTEKSKREVYAYYISMIDDTRALPALHEISELEDLDYVDYVEIRNAIEKLGGICVQRDYSNDPLYARIHGEN